MRTIQNQVKAFAIAGIIATTLVSATPAFAGSVTVIKNGSRMCIALDGISAFVPEIAAALIGAVLEKFGC